MTSSTIIQSAAAVAYNKHHTQRRIQQVLDALWQRVDAHGTVAGHSDDYTTGHDAACREIIKMIEAAGGMYHGVRRVDQQIEAIREAAQ